MQMSSAYVDPAAGGCLGTAPTGSASRWDGGSRPFGVLPASAAAASHRDRFSRQPPCSPVARDAPAFTPTGTSHVPRSLPAGGQTITEALQAEMKISLGNFLYLFFSPPSGADLRAGGPGHPVLKAPGQRSFFCRLMITPTDLFFEQIPTDKHQHGEATLGPTVTHTSSSSRLAHPPHPGGHSQRGSLAFPPQQPLEEDVFCVPRVSLLHVSTFQASRVRAAVGVCLHTRSFQCLYLLFLDPLDQENLLQELRAEKGRLTDRAFASSLGREQILTGNPSSFSEMQLASPAPKTGSGTNPQATEVPTSQAGVADTTEVLPIATPVSGFGLWGGTPPDSCTAGVSRHREMPVGLRLLRLSAQRSEAAAFATLAGIHVVPRAHLRLVVSALNGAYSDRLVEPTLGVNPKWFACDMATEFQRQQFSENWRLTYANSRFALCESYPPVLIVPSRANDDLVMKAAASRTRARLLVATYYHKATGAAIVRGAQPRGADVLIRSFMETPTMRYTKFISDTCPAGRTRTFDLRPKTNAVANVFHGGGFESGEGVSFANLGNITHVRTSYMKLFALIHPTLDGGPRTPAQALAALAETGWLDVVHMILTAAVDVAKTVSGYGDRPAEIAVVHCSDGWDRTSQVAALAQVLLDPFFRTVKGLCVLIDKDFVQFGHMFATRSACFGGDAAGWLAADQHAPIFFLFTDCLRILLKLHPESFEYNEEFLLLLLDLFHSGVFGNFAFNSYAEILQVSGTRTTPSLWTFLEHLLRDPRAESPSSGFSHPESTSLCESHSDEKSTSVGHSPNASSTSEPFSKAASPTQANPAEALKSFLDSYANPFYSPDDTNNPLTLEVRDLDVDLWREFFLRYPARSSAGAPAFRPPEKLSSRSSSVGDSAGRSTPVRTVEPTALGRPLTPQYPKRQPPGFTSRQTQSCLDLPALAAGGAGTRSESNDPSPSSLPRSSSAAEHALTTPTNQAPLLFPNSPLRPVPSTAEAPAARGFASTVLPGRPSIAGDVAAVRRQPVDEEDEFACDLNDGASPSRQAITDGGSVRTRDYSLSVLGPPPPPSAAAAPLSYSEVNFHVASAVALPGAAPADIDDFQRRGGQRSMEASRAAHAVGGTTPETPPERCYRLLDDEWFEC